MAKIATKPGTMLYPLPAVMVSVGSESEQYNIITISWTGTINSSPPMCYISVRPERHSYGIVKSTLEFVINLTTQELIYAADWCGMNSGKDFNKFKEMNLTPTNGQIVKAPLIKESPVNIECQVNRILPLGSHHIFMADIVAVNVDEEYLDKNKIQFTNEKNQLISYAFNHYFSQGIELGKYGFSAKTTDNDN